MITAFGIVVGMMGLALAAEEKKEENKNAKEATITKVDPKAKTITLKMKDAQGKEVEKTYTLTEDIRYLDNTGKVAAVDVFQSGNQVLVIEADGKLKEVRRKDTKNPGAETKDKGDKKDKG